ncbi:MAG TPA: hypothetical protein PLM14_12950 [Candidatus Hydrogenedentes bacterium]|nr:hypothetical protein [Candidatus Hydrogenedentota bacterium]
MRWNTLIGVRRISRRNVPAETFIALVAFGVMVVAATPAAAAELKAEPDVLVFHRTDESVATVLTRDGQLLPAAEMGEIKLWASGHDYDEMFRYDRSDGALRLTPTEYCEVGSYDLVLKTSSGDLKLQVFTPLDEMPGTLEKVAASMGITVEELRKRMGLVTSLGTAEVTFTLPEVYYEGQALDLQLDAIEGATCTWKVNDTVVAEGTGAVRLFYVFQKPGLAIVEYTASRGGQTITSAKDSTMVAKVPAIEWKVPAKVEFTLRAIPGYGKYTWTVNGKPAGQGDAMTHTFTEAGPATIECLCEEPASGPEGTFLRISYEVTVTG